MSTSKETLKSVMTKVILPTLLLLGVLLLVHYALIGSWAFFTYGSEEIIYVFITSMVGCSFSFLAYMLWSVRRIIIKSYDIIHKNHIEEWVEEISYKYSKELIEKGQTLIDKDSLAQKIRIKLNDKINSLPTGIEKIARKVISRIKWIDFFNKGEDLLRSKDAVGLGYYISNEIDTALHKSAASIVPSIVKYLIPLNLIYIIVMWLFL